jgi:hypothetical protein
MHDSMLREGFADPVSDAQAVFRQALAAMSEPGTRHEIQVPASAPEGLRPQPMPCAWRSATTTRRSGWRPEPIQTAYGPILPFIAPAR